MPNTYILGREAVFGITEVCMTIIAACIPFLRPLLHKFVDSKGRIEMPLALKNMAADSNGNSGMGHPHTRLGSSSTFTTTTMKHGGAREEDAVAILEAESVAEHDSLADTESNESGTIVRKTHVSVQYRPREVHEGECRGHCDVGVSGPGEH